MSKMITPNRLEQATTELSSLDLGGFKIPKEIQEKEKGYYVCVCVKSRENANKLGHTFSAKLCYAMPSLWQEMNREKESGRVKDVFMGMFEKVVILHNPSIKEKPNKLNTTTKGKVKKMHEDGIPSEEIAKVLEVDINLVKEHINKLL